MKIILSADDFGRSRTMNQAINYAMISQMVQSTALIMGSEYTDEAIKMAIDNGYIQNVHCHLNLAACLNVGNHFVPLNDNFKQSRFCKNGEFSNARYYSVNFFKDVNVIYQEIETQFLTFKEKTKNQANYLHLDFHRYMNLSLPVAIAYNRLIKNYNIHSARFFGEHQWQSREAKIVHIIHRIMMTYWCHSKVYIGKSSRIEYFLAKKEHFIKDKTVELFVHPDYRDGVLIDRTSSVWGNGFRPLEEQIKLVNNIDDVEFVSWTSIC